MAWFIFGVIGIWVLAVFQRRWIMALQKRCDEQTTLLYDLKQQVRELDARQKWLEKELQWKADRS